jgi:hypothetical protein
VKRTVIVLLAVGFTVGLLIIVRGRLVPSERVYTLAEVEQGRLHQRGRWVGRTVLVRGQLLGVTEVGCPTGQSTRCVTPLSWEEIHPPVVRWPGLARPGLPRHLLGQAYPLVVVRAAGVTGRTPMTRATLLLASLQLASRLPIVGHLVPTSFMDQGVIYRVRILPSRHCVGPPVAKPCSDVVLLQVAP